MGRSIRFLSGILEEEESFIWRRKERERSSRRRSCAFIQVSGVTEDVPDGVRLGVRLAGQIVQSYRLCLYLSPSILSSCLLFTDLLSGYYQVRHVDAAVGQPSLRSQV